LLARAYPQASVHGYDFHDRSIAVARQRAAQAGPAAVRQLADDAGFSRSRQVTQTPVNIILELRP